MACLLVCLWIFTANSGLNFEKLNFLHKAILVPLLLEARWDDYSRTTSASLEDLQLIRESRFQHPSFPRPPQPQHPSFPSPPLLRPPLHCTHPCTWQGPLSYIDLSLFTIPSNPSCLLLYTEPYRTLPPVFVFSYPVSSCTLGVKGNPFVVCFPLNSTLLRAKSKQQVVLVLIQAWKVQTEAKGRLWSLRF